MPINNPVAQGKIDVALSNFARKYSNNALVSQVLFPRLDVAKQSDKYWLFGTEDLALTENILRRPTAGAERIKQTLSTAAYLCEDHSLARLISDEERGNWEAGDVEQAATATLMSKIMLDQENRAAVLATNTANYAANYSVTLAGGDQWSDLANSDPIDDVETAKLKLLEAGLEPTHIFIPPQVLQQLKQHPDIIDRFKYTKPGSITLADLGAVFEIPNVVRAAAVKKNAAGTTSWVWGKNVIVANVNPVASMADSSFGKTFIWTGAPNTVGGFSTEIGRIDPPSAKSDELAVHAYYQQKITSNISGYLIKNAVA